MGKTNTYENFDSELNDYEMKKSSHDRKSKKSEDLFSSSKKSTIKSPNHSKTDLSKDNKNVPTHDFETDIFIDLIETPTTTLFVNQSFYVQSEKEEVLQHQDELNNNYRLKSKETAGNDNYLNHSTQTFMSGKKNQDIQTEEKDNKEIGIQVMGYVIKQEIVKEEKKEIDEILDNMNFIIEEEMGRIEENPFTYLSADINTIKFSQTKKESIASSKLLKNTNRIKTKKTQDTKKGNINRNNVNNILSINLNKEKNKNSKNITNENQTLENITLNSSVKGFKYFCEQELNRFKESLKKDQKNLLMFDSEKNIYQKDHIKKSALLIEKMLNQFLLKKKYLQIKNYPDKKSTKNVNIFTETFKKNKNKEDKSKEDNNFLKKILTFEFPESANLSVNCIDQNAANENLFLSVYGDCSEGSSEKGLICLFTLKNTKNPEEYLKTDSSVLTAKFSKNNPNLFACGFYDGNIAIYDTRHRLKKAVATSSALDDLQHFDSVWNLNWIPKGKTGSNSESIISISSDGKLLEWNYKKSLEVQELKIINRLSNSEIKDNLTSNNINFRYTSGFHFDFPKTDFNVYYISTEEGLIHRCSKSYKERYLQTYYGHNGTVYKIKCNPFDSDILLSSSADWTVKIWNSYQEKPVLTLKSLDLSDEVFDIAWNPFCSTSFANVCKDGRLELWDINKKNFDPLFIDYGDVGVSRNCVTFINDNPILLTGDISGKIDIFRYFGYNNSFIDVNEEVQILHKTFNVQKYDTF